MTRFLMVGGFLGAGKTTTLGNLARLYLKQGLKVGLITNDQADDLVDTHALREQGLSVEEVAGACFCCKFNDLMEKVENLETKVRPDVILAEPVGSCTDLVATVIQPLKNLYQTKISVAPYPVLFKPSHGLKILRGESSGFSPKAAYIYRKQLEEADSIVINRMDELSTKEADELVGLLADQFPDAPVLRVSAKTGLGLDLLAQFLDQEGDFGKRILDIDYDTYAEGEAELGWLNSMVRVWSGKPFDLDRLLFEIVNRLRSTLLPTGAEVAHLKAIGLWESSYAVVNLISNHDQPELSVPSRKHLDHVNLIVNARVALDPAQLQKHVLDTVRDVVGALGGEVHEGQTQSFRPGRPTPTHRYQRESTATARGQI
jgi:G3E family GTPase